MRLLVIVGALALAGCQAGATSEPANPSSPVAANATLYRYAGSKQCEGGGATPQQVTQELAAAGVAVVEAGCATDGRMYAAMCGASDGRIVVVQVRRADARAAQAKGFKPLAELPEAARSVCR